MHQRLAAALDEALDEIARDPARGPRGDGVRAPALADDRPAHAEGLDGPEGGRRQAGRGHAGARTRCRSRASRDNPEHLRQLEEWLRSYRPEELFDERGPARARARGARARAASRRMSANPHANGGALLRDLALPDFRDYAVDVRAGRDRRRARRRASSARFLRDVIARNPETFRLFGPDETASNRLGAVFERHRPGLGRRDARRPTSTSRRTAA